MLQKTIKQSSQDLITKSLTTHDWKKTSLHTNRIDYELDGKPSLFLQASTPN